MTNDYETPEYLAWEAAEETTMAADRAELLAAVDLPEAALEVALQALAEWDMERDK